MTFDLQKMMDEYEERKANTPLEILFREERAEAERFGLRLYDVRAELLLPVEICPENDFDVPRWWKKACETPTRLLFTIRPNTKIPVFFGLEWLQHTREIGGFHLQPESQIVLRILD